MSLFEEYDGASAHYDKFRQAIGFDIITEAVAKASEKLGPELNVLDAGCGSGNYLRPLSELSGVSMVVGFEFSSGMLKQCEAKVQGIDTISLQQGSVLEPPFEQGSFDVCVVNQVLHHLDDGGMPFPNATMAVETLSDLLRPGGLLIVNFQEPTQIEACWYYELFKEKMRDYARLREQPREWYEKTLRDAGFTDVSFKTVVEPFFLEEDYLDISGPDREEWRRSESAWAALSTQELGAALTELSTFRQEGKLEALVAEKERLRQELGLSTSVVAWKTDANPGVPVKK